MARPLAQLMAALLPLAAAAGQADSSADYLRGRSLAENGRYVEAVTELTKVPQEDSLFPYAAKAMLYSAWQSLDVDFEPLAAALLECPVQEVAELAAASLAEYQICVLGQAESIGMAALHTAVAKNPALKPTLAWLEIEQMRLRGQLDAAIHACQEVEANRELPLATRQRVRLALARVYYAKEQQARRSAAPQESAATRLARTAQSAVALVSRTGDDDDDSPGEETAQDVEGKGEETLLSFITANPDSPLLEEAFRLLRLHRAFETSAYARAKLEEWVQDPDNHKRRASISLLVLQHLLNTDDAPDAPLDSSCATAALATCPKEPAARTLLLEQVRRSHERGQWNDARKLLATIDRDAPTPLQAAHISLWELILAEGGSPAAAYAELAKTLPPELSAAALNNALVTDWMRQYGTDAARDIIGSAPTPAAAARLRLARAGLYAAAGMRKEALADLRHILGSPDADHDTAMRAKLCLCGLVAETDPPEALHHLQDMQPTLAALPARLRLAYYGTLETALRHAHPADRAAALVDSMLQQAEDAPANRDIREQLSLHRACRLTAAGKTAAARELLRRIIRENPRGDNEPRANLLLAYNTETGGSLDNLKGAIRLYSLAADRGSGSVAHQAAIRRASLQARIGRARQAVQNMQELIDSATAEPEDNVLAHVVLANALAADGKPESVQAAVACLDRMLTAEMRGSLPRDWQFLLLVTHATYCVRAGMGEPALADYLAVLDMQPAAHAPQGDPEWIVFYTAASGAVTQLTELQRYTEAAEMADRAAAWNKEQADPATAELYTEWANTIRQMHIRK